jgi:pimeloyl-ACP methyl ester carboxylesterase
MPLARTLARKYEVILLGLRGDQAGTVLARGREVGDDASEVGHLIETLGLESPTIFGVSYGAVVGLELAITRPATVGSLVMYGGEARFGRLAAAGLAARVLERFPLPRDSRFVNQFFNLLYGEKPEPGELTEFIVQQCWETDQAVIAARLRALEAFDARGRLNRVLAPTLVLAGERDVVVGADRQKAMAMGMQDARVQVVPRAGHVGFLTEKKEVAGQVHRFLRQKAVQVG